jgi:hypothetical protein
LKKKKRKKKIVKTKEIRHIVGKWNFSQNACPGEYKGKEAHKQFELPLHANKDPGREKPGSIRAE